MEDTHGNWTAAVAAMAELGFKPYALKCYSRMESQPGNVVYRDITPDGPLYTYRKSVNGVVVATGTAISVCQAARLVG